MKQMVNPTKSGVKKHVVDVLRDKAVVIHQDQRCPNTYVLLDCCFGGQHYTASGWSKVSHPDEWEAEKGLVLAREKALAYRARTIVSEWLDRSARLPEEERPSVEEVYQVLLEVGCEDA